MGTSFICEKDTFSYIYELEKRRSERDWNNSYLSKIKLNGIFGDNLKKASKRMLKILSEKLRSGDVVYCWDNAYFMLILNNISKDNTARVMERISHHFYKKEFNFTLELDFSYKPLN